METQENDLKNTATSSTDVPTDVPTDAETGEMIAREKPRKPISDPKSVMAATHDTDEATAHQPPPFDRGQAREKIQP